MPDLTTGFPRPSICPKCKTLNPFKTPVCPKCGSPMEDPTKVTCMGCGEKDNPPKAQNCMRCGRALKPKA
jgi:ribosomal protein L40E